MHYRPRSVRSGGDFMFDTLYSQIGGLIMVAVCVFALWQGDQPERVGAGSYLLAWLATLVFQDDVDLFSWQPLLMAIDFLVLLIFIGLAWKSRKIWPVWAAGFQVLSLMSYLIQLVDERLPSWSYLTIVNLASYGILVSLAIGAFWAWQERKALEYDG